MIALLIEPFACVPSSLIGSWMKRWSNTKLWKIILVRSVTLPFFTQCETGLIDRATVRRWQLVLFENARWALHIFQRISWAETEEPQSSLRLAVWRAVFLKGRPGKPALGPNGRIHCAPMADAHVRTQKRQEKDARQTRPHCCTDRLMNFWWNIARREWMAEMENRWRIRSDHQALSAAEATEK